MREFCHKMWWDSSRMWFAFDLATNEAVGTICLGENSSTKHPCGTVQWLAVLPAYRRRGIARLLLHRLEHEALRRGYSRLELDTLDQWQAAHRLYLDMGFKPIDRRAH
jgi:GNAT superfamily N-acetyltransferase